MAEELIKMNYKIGFVRCLILAYFALNVIVLCLLNFRFDFLLLGGFFFLIVSFVTGNVAYKEITKCTLLRKRIFFLIFLDLTLSVIAVHLLPFLFVMKIVVFIVFILLIANHDLSSTRY